jgi:hypothetical protein
MLALHYMGNPPPPPLPPIIMKLPLQYTFLYNVDSAVFALHSFAASELEFAENSNINIKDISRTIL